MTCEWVTYATPLGLVLDIIGFVLVILNGHALFLRVGSGPPSPGDGKDGDMYIEAAGGDEQYIRQLKRAWVGVTLVILGFFLQILGTIVSNLLL